MIKKLSLVVALLIVLGACADSGSSETTLAEPTDTTLEEPSGTTSEAPPATEAGAASERWTGTTVDTASAPVGDVTVDINGVEAQSGGDGAFALEVPAAADGRYVINAEAVGFLPVSQIHVGAAVDGMMIELQPVEQFTIDPTEPVAVEDSSGTEIAIEANQLVDEEGNPATEDLTLNMYTYDLTEEEMVGDMSGVNEEGEPVAMESAGAFYADFTDDAGNEYTLADGTEAEVSMPCEPAATDEALTVWSYDPETGLWVEEGPATIEDGRCEGAVTHFSYWNFDYEKREPACIAINATSDFLAELGEPRMRAVLQVSPVRVRDMMLTQEANVLINLPTNTDVQLFSPPDAATPLATVNSGEPWGGTGVPADYAACNGQLQLPPSPAASAASTLDGTVVNATNDAPLAEATVCISGTDKCGTTGDDGTYRIEDVAPGDYTLTAAAGEFIGVDDQPVTVASGAAVTQDFALSPQLGAGETRIVLTWGERPNDLDTYVWVPGSTENVYYDRKTVGGTSLDVDATSGRGPETVTIAEPVAGTYTYAVKNLSGTPAFAESGAIVRVSQGDREIGSYPVPTTGAGDWWYVFDLNAETGEITPVNTLSAASPLPTS